MERINSSLIAPCGMNCAVCRAYLRARNSCRGCNFVDANTPKTRLFCPIRICQERHGEFCFACDEFPCRHLRRMDERYRTKYGMSEIDNLEYIRDKGMEEFIENERRRWQSPKGILCVHDREYH